MTLFDKVFIFLLCLASVGLLFSIISFFMMGQTKRKIKKIKKRKVKKKKQKQKKRKIRELTQQKKKQRGYGIFLLIVCFASGFLSWYSLYYQSMQLSSEDSTRFVQGYYLLDNVEKEIEAAKTTDNEIKSEKNIKLLAAKLSSYGLYMANVRNTPDGQKNLNANYKSMKELGINLSAQPNDFFKNEELLKEYESDIEGIKANQKIVIKYFKLNENALENRK